jgi:phage terminase Nu1 subunit (DNA packaging protein)
MSMPESVSTSEMSKLFAVSGKTIAAWAKAGIVTRVAHGRFDLAASIQAFAKHASKQTQRDGGETVAGQVGSQRARLLQLQGDRLAAQIAIEQGELLRKAAVVHEVNSTFFVVRSAVLSAKARIGNRLSHLSKHDLVEIDNELRRALTELGQCEYEDDEGWTVSPDELAAQIRLPREMVDRLANSGVLAAPDHEGRLSLWASIRTLVARATMQTGNDGDGRRM